MMITVLRMVMTIIMMMVKMTMMMMMMINMFTSISFSDGTPTTAGDLDFSFIYWFPITPRQLGIAQTLVEDFHHRDQHSFKSWRSWWLWWWSWWQCVQLFHNHKYQDYASSIIMVIMRIAIYTVVRKNRTGWSRHGQLPLSRLLLSSCLEKSKLSFHSPIR